MNQRDVIIGIGGAAGDGVASAGNTLAVGAIGAVTDVLSEADVANGGCAANWLAICAYEEPL